MKSQENAFLFSWLLCLLLFAGQAQSFGCGIRNKSEDKHHRVRRVIGGSDAEMNSWPWIVNFINKTDLKQDCAGSIIDREWLLSAGHCFLSGDTLFPLENYTYRVADHKLNVIDTYEYQIQPSHVFIHPKYILGNDDLPGDYDISLIKLAQPLDFSEQVRAVCLPEKGTNFTKRDTCYLAGWGNIINNSTYNRSPVLKEAKLDLVSFEDCNRNVSYNGTIPNRFLCAGFPIGGTDGCYGDSGGPLQCERNGTWTQVGIMAWGQGCGQPNKYGVYSDIKVLLPFIRAIQAGPNGNLTAYYKKTFEETNPNITGRDLINLQKLFTRESYFSDVDLVRNLQLLPKEIKLLSRTTLKDLVFVSHVDNLTANATRLETITQVFRDQANRLDLYDKSKEVAQELNITFAEILKLSNLSKDDLLNDKADVFDKVRKMFYINSHLAKLRKYERMLEGYNTGIDITINQIKLIKELTMLSLNDLKKLDEKSLKQILVKGNIKVFTEKMTIRNISSFFDVALSQLKNTSVIEVLLEIFNINLGDYASMYPLTFQQVNVIKGVKISNVSNSGDFSLYNITGAILKSKETDECSEKDKRCSTRSTCKNVIGSFSCRCQKGYVGDGIRCSTGNTIYKSVIRLNEPYSPSLNDPESYAYTVLAKKIQSGISRAVNSSKAFSDFVGTQVIGFRKGSVLADFLLVFALEEKDEINLSKLKDVLSSAIRSGFLLLSIDSSEPLKLSKTDLCKLGSHSCHENAICTPENDRFTCKCRPNFHGDGVNCEDPCNKTVCHSNSYCYRGLGGKAKCICDRDFGEDGDGKCIRMNDYKVPLIVVSCIAGVLFLVLLIILFCKYGRHQEKTVEINNREAGIHNTGYQNIHLQNIRENPRLHK